MNEQEYAVDNAGTAIAPWDPQAGEVAALVSTISDPLEVIAGINDTIPLGDFVESGEVFKVNDVTIHAATVTQDDGEVIEVRRTVLHTDKGVNVAAVSEGVVGSIRQISALYGPPPWDGLKLKAVQKSTRKGFRTYRLIPVK
jgi:hypothetical protein